MKSVMFVIMFLLWGSYAISNDSESKKFSIDSARISNQVFVSNCPEWMNTAVFYQIYPQSFYDSNGDGIGDLQGIIQKLDYVKSLGVDGIWINPFFKSPFKDAGYDISNYFQVAPRYGTNADAEQLFNEAHQRELKILFDYVVSYTSIEHSWFQASCDPEPNKYSNWYIWTNGTWFPGMEKYSSRFIQGYCNRNGNFMNNFFWHQPALNFGYGSPDPEQPWQLPVDHPDVIALKEELKNVLRFWMDMGADGFRADMAGALVKDDTENKNALFWKEIREILDKEYPEAFSVAEWSYPKAAIPGGFYADFYHWFTEFSDLYQKENKRNLFFNGHSFFEKEGKGDITAFLEKYMDQLNAVQGKGYVCIPVGNHDLIRIRNFDRSYKDLEVISAFQMTLPGIPFVYYGDEIGMKQLSGIPTKEGAYGTRGGGRTPMQWNRSENKGFSPAAPDQIYFPVDPDENAPNVADQEKDPNSFLNKVRALIQLRKREKALCANGLFTPVYAKPFTYPFIYIRSWKDENILVVLNPSAQKGSAQFHIQPAIKKRTLLSGTKAKIKINGEDCHLEIPGQSYAIYKITL